MLLFEIKVEFIYKRTPKLTGRFNCVHVNEEQEVLLLFQDISDSYDPRHQKMLRYAIPLNDIESLEIVPIYEDNGQKIHSC